jgi:hypothetical protein
MNNRWLKLASPCVADDFGWWRSCGGQGRFDRDRLIGGAPSAASFSPSIGARGIPSIDNDLDVLEWRSCAEPPPDHHRALPASPSHRCAVAPWDLRGFERVHELSELLHRGGDVVAAGRRFQLCQLVREQLRHDRRSWLDAQNLLD